jgi:uncharacterized repeat protein (TIGR01451 family)
MTKNRFPAHARDAIFLVLCSFLGILALPTGASAQTNLGVTKTVTNATVTGGDVAVFHITVTNLGPQDATGVVLTEVLPPGLAFDEANPRQGSFNGTTGIWTVGALTSGSSATLLVEAVASGSTPVANTVTVTGNEAAPEPTNNTASVTVTPQAALPTLPPATLVLLGMMLAQLAAWSLRARADAHRA